MSRSVILELKTPKSFILSFGRRNAPTDDGGVYPPLVYTKNFDTPEKMMYYLETEVLPTYSGEEGFFYRTEAVL